MAPKLRPVMVVIVGMTGAGKTTFASVASGQELRIGHGLDPCTQDPQAIRFAVDGRQVVLIDTPGFDDSKRNDVEILGDIAKWLESQGFTKSQPLDGLILLHPITEERLDSGMEKKRTRLIEKILGKDAYNRVVIATTMWGSIADEYHDEVERLMGFRQAERGVWNDFYRGGATIMRHDNTPESAHKIIRLIMEKSDKAEKVETLLQKELADNSVRFKDTTVGKELKSRVEDEIAFILDQLLEHRRERPPDGYRKSQNPEERRMWEEWEDERQNLTKNLEERQGQLKRLNSFIFRLARVWSRLFR